MAEGARLESVYTGNRIVGSNPTPSANSYAGRTDHCVVISAKPWREPRPCARFSVPSLMNMCLTCDFHAAGVTVRAVIRRSIQMGTGGA